METELPPEPSPEPPRLPEVAEPPVSAPPAVVVDAAPPAPPQYADRSTGLMIFGVIQIILGLLAALFVPFAAFAAFMSRLAQGAGKMHPGQFIGTVGIYAAVAIVFLCLGIGSVQMKRWARALTLVTSWYWMIAGALITVLLTAVLPVMVQSMLRAQQSAQSPGVDTSTGVMAVVLTLIIVFMAFFLVVVPIAFVIFYSRNDVAETCRHRDPVERWTDRTPLPVLGASVVLAIQASFSLMGGITMPVFPFFGRYFSGIGGFACFLIVAILDAYLAVAIFRLRSAGWWLAIITTPIRLLSMALTYWRADLTQAYAKMGWSDEQVKVINSNPVIHSHVTLWWSLLTVVIFYGYLIWLKRYFKTQATAPIEALPAQAG